MSPVNIFLYILLKLFISLRHCEEVFRRGNRKYRLSRPKYSRLPCYARNDRFKT
ncbi:MAG TPA: hypothetical protein VEC36_00175 [Patescibacteria group bacterium]|nr:hypothetical protein [Patescibacteria group bacterium]